MYKWTAPPHKTRCDGLDASASAAKAEMDFHMIYFLILQTYVRCETCAVDNEIMSLFSAIKNLKKILLKKL